MKDIFSTTKFNDLSWILNVFCINAYFSFCTTGCFFKFTIEIFRQFFKEKFQKNYAVDVFGLYADINYYFCSEK